MLSKETQRALNRNNHYLKTSSDLRNKEVFPLGHGFTIFSLCKILEALVGEENELVDIQNWGQGENTCNQTRNLLDRYSEKNKLDREDW